MMMEAIFDGDFRPDETEAWESQIRWDLGKEIRSLQEDLKARLDLEDYLMVEQLLEQDLTAHSIECECHFKYGFSAGLILLQEAYQEIKFRL